MRTRTKIICTLGPATDSYEKIIQLIDAGMNVARVNMSHGLYEDHKKTIDKLKKARKERGVPLAIMLDTKGPEMRIGTLDTPLALDKGTELIVTKAPKEGEITIEPFQVIRDLKVGGDILFDDGYITGKIVQKKRDRLVIEIQNPGMLKSQKGVNIPNVELALPAVTERDISDIAFGCKNGIDLLAASFIRSSEHIYTIKELLKRNQAGHVLVIAKIESALGVKNFDSILQAADGIMVARGDLGVELPITQVPKLQKVMIRKCYRSFKPVVTATQMLESMISNPRPTRAEVSDVANAIYDSTSAVMLSGETAIGKYPIETVELMRNAITEAEKDFDYEGFFHRDASGHIFHDIPSSVALSAVETAYSADGKALIALTTRGFTAKLMGRFRPEMPIIAVTPDEKTYHQLAFVWGTVPIHEKVNSVEEGVRKVGSYILNRRLVRYGDLIVITSGTPFGVSGTTNMIVVDSIGAVLVRGRPGKGERISGKVALFLSFDPERSYDFKNKIVVMSDCTAEYGPHLEGSLGLILQNHPDDFRSEELVREFAHHLKLPCLVRADAACTILKKDQLITLDPSKGLIFEGAIDSE
ncbi:MAG: pyruvate kinase [Chlamydiota bacterium]